MTAPGPPFHLTPAQLAALREELLRSQRRLERSERASRAAAKPVTLDQSAVGRLSRIDAIQNQSMTRGLQERDEAQRARIADALRRIEEGTYGSCGSCAGAIDFQRLLVFPEAATCAACGRG